MHCNETTSIVYLDRNKKENYSLLESYFMMLRTSFSPPLDSYVDIKIYANKLLDNAKVGVLYYNQSFVGLYAVYLNIGTKLAYLSSIGVLESYKGSGFADLLLNDAINQAYQARLSIIKLEVYSSYSRAVKFYEKKNFVFSNEETNNSQTCYMYRILE